MTNATSKLLITAAAGFLGACASTHHLQPEAVGVDANVLQTSKSLSAVRFDAAAWPQAQWWTAYNDPQLNELIDEALAGNPGLRIAEARTRAALAQVAAADTARVPSAGVSV